MAWLHATPKPPEGSKRAQNEGLAKMSRLDAIKRSGVAPKMPPNPAPHIVTWLVEIGLTETSGMAAVPLSWSEINAWQQATSIRLAPWEARLIRALSLEYLAEIRRAESENCSPPWRTEPTQRERDIELARLRMVLG